MAEPGTPGLRPITLITGASAGIGIELARVFASHGHELVLVARREQALTALADEIAAAGRPRPIVLPADLTQRPTPRSEIAQALEERALEPAYVVNNAGFGLVGAAAALDAEEQLSMIDLNVRTLTDLSLRWVDSLERHQGGILNVASVAAFLPGPHMAVYYATKAYRALVQRGAASGAEAARRARHHPVPRPGADRIPGARRRVLPLHPAAPGPFRGRRWRSRVIAPCRRAGGWWCPASPTRSCTVLTRLAPRGLVLAMAAIRHNRRR